MRSNTTERNIWAQLGLSACAVVLPPLALGAALYSMLSVRDEGAERPRRWRGCGSSSDNA